ncbi:MAG: LemA family protein [Clostridium sp.]|uniref:LemA family protein n=1 Tax=Clostridium sp. TaxID=1506 RepID=UPI002FC646D2
MEYIQMLLLVGVLFVASMFMAFKQPKLKMEDILKDINSGFKIRKQMMEGILGKVSEVSEEEAASLKKKMEIFDKLEKETDLKKKVELDEEFDDCVVSFLTVLDRCNALENNFSYIELSLHYKDLEIRIINEKFHYNGFVNKYNTRREGAICKPFVKLYGFKKEEPLYLSDAIKDVLTRKNQVEEVACEEN